jgi:hypothetical protein
VPTLAFCHSGGGCCCSQVSVVGCVSAVGGAQHFITGLEMARWAFWEAV